MRSFPGIPGALRLAVIVCLFPPNLKAATVDHLVVFGDSYSDTGNMYAEIAYPTPPGYTIGRATDGADSVPSTKIVGVWEEQLAPGLGMPVPQANLAHAGGLNFAFSGAETSTYDNSVDGYGMAEQVSEYLNSSPPGIATGLHVFWGGLNDLMDASNPTTAEHAAIQNISNEITSVIAAGGNYFAWVNLPPLDLTPKGAAATDTAALQSASAAFATDMQTAITSLKAAHPGVSLIAVDAYSVFKNAVQSPGTYGFSNGTGSAQSQSGVNPDQYMFWDNIHPTTAMHHLLAQAAQSAIKAGLASSSPPPPNGVGVSDDFTGSSLNGSLWTAKFPTGGSASVANGRLALAIPGGSNHQPYGPGLNVGRVVQSVSNSDFDVAIKLDSQLTASAQTTYQGLLIGGNASNYIYFTLQSDGSNVDLFAASVDSGTQTVRLSATPAASYTTPTYLRMQRSGTTYTAYWSLDAVNWTQAATFSDGLTVTAMGPFAGNYNATATNAPAVTASVDWFYNLDTTSPSGTTATPVFNPGTESFSTAPISVSLSDATSGAAIYYTTDGSTPKTSSAVYSSPLSLSATTTVNAMAVAGGNSSAVASASYTYAPVTSGGINYGTGFSAGSISLNGSAKLSGTHLRLTDGGGYEASTAFYSTPVNVQAFTSAFSFQLTNASADGFAFILQGTGATALGGYGGALGYGPASPGGSGGIAKSVAIKFDLYSNAGEGSDSTGLFTNGAYPTVPSTDLTSTGVNLHSGDVFNAALSYNGTTLTVTITDTVTNATATQSYTVNIPSFVGASTAYVGFGGGTGGLSATQDILTWTFTPQGSSPPPSVTATPTFNPGSESFATAPISVTLQDSTSGAAIYYTTDGSTPNTTSSTRYSGAISVSATTTIKAIATASGYSNSAVASATYTYAPVSSGGPVSDNFDEASLNTSLWTIENPLGDGMVQMNGSAVTLNVPQAVTHDPWTSGDNAVRVMQPIANGDFGVEVRFQSIPLLGNQDEGILVEQDSADFVRFDVYFDGSSTRLFAAGVSGSSATTFVNSAISLGSAPLCLRLSRAGSTWTGSWSSDCTNFTAAPSFTYSLNVARVGPFAATNNATPANSPAFTASVDYMFNLSNRIANNDGPKPYSIVNVDANPASTLVEKTLADIRGSGHLNPVIGMEYPSPGGIYWYDYPSNGPSGTWTKHTIVANGNAYEDIVAYDVNGDGAVDVIASYDPTDTGNYSLVWFQNPRGNGGDPAADTWVQHVIGATPGENNMVLADFDGDGLMDVATASHIFFQNSPTSWTGITYNSSFRGIAKLDIGSGKGAINLVGTGPSPYNIVWFENPRETGGNARTGTWAMHTIAAGYTCPNSTACPDGNDVAVYNAVDLNHDGQMDVIAAQSEGPNGSAPPAGGMAWYQAPSDRRNGTWTKHVIDANFVDAHMITVADMDKSGTPDIVTTEQDQAPFRRVAVFYNDGSGNFTEQVLSNVEGHNQQVGDIVGNGSLDILNSGHGYFGAPHPLQIFLNPY